MRPHIESLPRGRCLHTVGRLPRTLPSRPYGLQTEAHRPSLNLQSNAPFLGQKRWVTKQHLSRAENARLEWARMAEEIKDGKRLSFLQHLESRGLVHDVVGFVSIPAMVCLCGYVGEICVLLLTLLIINFRDRDLLNRIFTERRVGMYAGVDPTGPSLHVGHMLPLMILAWGYVWGLPVTFLVSYCKVKDWLSLWRRG